MHSLESKYLNALRFDSAQMGTIRALGQARGRQDLFTGQSPEQLDRLRQVAIVESSESSNRIEGVTAPPDRLEAIVLKSSTPRNRSEQEIAGYRDALQLIHESQKQMSFSVNVILQLHGVLSRYLPAGGGRFKSTDNEIVERGPDGGLIRVRFKPTPAAQTPQAMEVLVGDYQNAISAPGAEPLVLVPLAVFDFLCIHPFQDGNGRVARLLALLLLYSFDYRVGRWISLERIVEESKETYYETLERSSQGWHAGKHDVHPWLNYFWGTLQRAYNEFEERVGKLVEGRGSKTDLVREAVMRRVAPFSISDIEADCPGVSRDMVRHVLRQMRGDGLIALGGKGRGARWSKSG